jgi:hypothetical protein
VKRNLTLNRYFLIILVVFLTACENQKDTISTETSFPTIVSLTQSKPTAASTVTLAPVIVTPSPLPTRLTIAIITPDPIQVERWKEYEDALKQSILPTWTFEPLLCEWDILTRAGQEIYVWALCGSSKGTDMRPAVIHLRRDGSIGSVEIPKRGSPSDVDRMFPQEVQAKFSYYTGDSVLFGRLKEMLDHLYYRETHSEEPPLIVLLATPMP